MTLPLVELVSQAIEFMKSRTKIPINGERSAEIAPDDFTKQLVSVLTSIRDGDFSARLPSDLMGLEGRVAENLNAIAVRMARFNSSLLRLRREVGEEGKIGERLPIGDAVGSWAERIEAINSLVNELSQPTVEVGRVIGAVAKGD